MDNVPSNRMANNTRGGCVRKAWKPPSSRPILIYFEFRRKPSLITDDPHSPNKLFATKYGFLILVDETILHDTSFFFFISFFFFFVIINFYKNHFIIIIIFFFFHEKFFFHVPGFSGMFRHVPECSVFQVLSTPELQSVFVILFFVLFSQLSMQLVADNIYLDFLEIYVFFRRLLL